MRKRKFRAFAPIRFGDLGGWSETRIYAEHEGAVTSFTGRIGTHVTLTVEPTEDGKSTVDIISHDTEERISVSEAAIRAGEYQNTLALFQAAFKERGMELQSNAGIGGWRHRKAILEIRSDTPPGAGLGTSASAGVAALAVLSYFRNGYAESPHTIAQLAHRLETEHLHLECGVQDQFACAYGGVNHLSVRYPNVHMDPISLSDATRNELNGRLLLIYTGKSHFSSAVHEKVIAEFQAGHNVNHFATLVACAKRGCAALRLGDLDALGVAFNDNWEAQKALHPDITTPDIEKLHAAALEAGCSGFKPNGAASGGTVTILARNSMKAVRDLRGVVRELGMELLPSELGFRGLQVWPIDEE